MAEIAADVRVITSGGRIIPAHSIVLVISINELLVPKARASPVLEFMLHRATKDGGDTDKIIPILGVPCDAVEAFIRFLYSQEEVGGYGVQLLALSHAFRVERLKRVCEAALATGLSVEAVVDVIKVARLCDAPWLYLRCMKLVFKDFLSVEKTEAWRFLQAHDPWLELEILQFLRHIHLRQKNRSRKKEVQETYLQLSQAMDCLKHLCKDYKEIWLHTKDILKNSEVSHNLHICQRLQFLIKHLVTCNKNRDCVQCASTRQLLRLHSIICHQFDCSVPLCKEFKLKGRDTERFGRDDETWRLLAEKVASITVMSSLSKRKR